MKNFIKFMVFVMVFTMSIGVVALPANSAGVNVLISVGSANTGTLAYPVLNQSSAEVLSAQANQDVYFKYKTSADEYASSDYVVLTASVGLTVVGDCGTATSDADGDGTGDISYTTTSGQTHTYYFDQTTTLATTSVEFCIRITTVATGNYSIIMTDSKAAGAEDIGGGLLYVGNDNDVTVTANVQSELEFRIRNYGDTADTNTCALGTLSTGSVATCNYMLKVRTNASEGYTVSWTRDGDLNDGTGTKTIDAVSEADGNITAGSEEYGVRFYGGENSDTTSSCTEQSIWNDDDSPVSTTPQSLLVCDGPNIPSATAEATNISTVEHAASISSSTLSGSYDQVVTYYVTANF